MAIAYIRARKLAAHSGMSMNALRLILNAPGLNPNELILFSKSYALLYYDCIHSMVIKGKTRLP